MPEQPPISIRIGMLEPQLRLRATEDSGLSGVARRDLERYYAVLADELRGLRLTEHEAMLLCDVLNGSLMEPHSYRLLWAEVEDACQLDGADDKWDIDGAEFVARLRSLSPGTLMAIVDAAERFWLLSRQEPQPDAAAALRAVGLLPAEKGATNASA